MAAETLINVYHNSQDVRSLYLTCAPALKCNLIAVAWHIAENNWFIPAVYLAKNIHKQGWYLDEEPTNKQLIAIMKECNVRAAVSQLNKYKFGQQQTMFITDTTIADQTYLFIIESYVMRVVESDLQKRNQRKFEMLLGNICHSIRTPLNNILHMTNMLMITDKTFEDKKKDDLARLNNDHLSYLNTSTVSLANSIFDIVDMVQLDLGKIKLCKDVFNIRELINEVISVGQSMNKSGVLLHSYVDQIVPEYAYSDKKRIQQILINLVTNALNHTKQGEISIVVYADLVDHEQEPSRIDAQQYEIKFTVTDTGVGIADEIKKKLFKPPEVSWDAKQHGIGLRVSHLLAGKLGGRLSLKHSETGKGSCFEFTLIVSEEEPPQVDRRTLKALGGRKVLCICQTDDKITLCKYMEKYGMVCALASSYNEVLLLHMDKSYDIVICQEDLLCPDGLPVADKLKAAWSSTIFVGIGSADQTRSKVFSEHIALPIEDFTFKNKLFSALNTEPADDAIRDMNILVVDDQHINRIVLEKLLRGRGYKNIDLAISGQDALDMVQKNIAYYDIIVCATRMSIMDGFEFAERLAAIKNIPVIGVTSQLLGDTQTAITHFVFKPIDISVLDSLIGHLYDAKYSDQSKSPVPIDD